VVSTQLKVQRILGGEQTGLGCGETDPGRLGLNKRHGGLEHI